ncbi:MAG: hypothetical protein ACRD2B_10320 [Terriglobia bacterium]
MLKATGLDWVNFQVMRRTNRSWHHKLGIDPETAADQLGHTLDVSLTVYTQTSVEARRRAVNSLDAFMGDANVVKVP